jgi:hypothetical protein
MNRSGMPGFRRIRFLFRLLQPVGQTRWVAAMPFQTLQAMLDEPDQPELT